MEAPRYRHVQVGEALRRLLLSVAAVALAWAIWWSFAGPPEGGRDPALSILLVVAPLLIIASGLFTSLTIEVTDTEVRWSFGIGWPRGRILRADLLRASIVRPSFFNGIGLHLTLHGWLWNVAVGRAVALTKRSGGEVLLGTDDPEGLLRALDPP